MAQHRLIVSRGFRIAGWVLGAPSCVAAVGFGVGAFIAGRGAAIDHSAPLSVSTYGLVGILANGAQGLGAVASVFNMFAAGVFGLLAVLGVVGTLFGVLLYQVGRGLKASAPWARGLGAVIAVVLLLVVGPALVVVSGAARAIDAAILAALAYALWVLVGRFRDPAPTPVDPTP